MCGQGAAFVPLVITTCTNRKRKPISDALHASALPEAHLATLAGEWGRRLASAGERFSAGDLYGGRSFQAAVKAARELDAELMIVSAGLGLVSADQKVPSYACTILAGASDSVAARATAPFVASEWWSAVTAASPFGRSLAAVASEAEGLICAALSDAYIDMIAGDLLALPEQARARLRIFTRAPLENIAPALQPLVMPYDDRLDGADSPIRGTRSDFAGRALAHFVDAVAGADVGAGRSAAEHADAVSAALSPWRMPVRVDRARRDDATMLGLIRDHWDATGGSSTRLLRRFRDELGIACEQGRFAALANTVRVERA